MSTQPVTQHSTVEQAVYKLITDKLQIDSKRLAPTSDLRNDLGADSLDVVELIVTLGRTFSLCPSHRSDSSIEDLRTINQIIALVDTNRHFNSHPA